MILLKILVLDLMGEKARLMFTWFNDSGVVCWVWVPVYMWMV
jgi:hypothetical protein